MDDNILRMYIDEVFSIYDNDGSGLLDKRQLVGFFNRLFQSFNDPRRVDQTSINQLLTSCDMNHDGQINKIQLFTLFKRVLMGDTAALSNLPHQQQNWGGNMYGQNKYNPNQYNGQPYQGNQYQNNFQGGNQYPPGNNQFGGSNNINGNQQPSWNNKPPQQNNQWNNGQNPRYY